MKPATACCVYWQTTRACRSESKQAYLYQLTPQGVAEKTKATARFLIKKQAEFEQLAQEIAELRREAADITKNQP